MATAKPYPLPDVLNPLLVRRPKPKPALSADAIAWRIGVLSSDYVRVQSHRAIAVDLACAAVST